MHLPPFFLEMAAAAFFMAGTLFGWLTRWNIVLAAVAGACLLFVAQCILHLMDDDTVSLLVADGPLAFYAAASLAGVLPAVFGAGLVRLYKRWRYA